MSYSPAATLPPRSFGRNSASGMALRGATTLILGLVLLLAPTQSVTFLGMVLLVLISLWLITVGVTTSLGALRERQYHRATVWTFAGALACVLAGIAGLVFPWGAAIIGTMIFLWVLASGVLIRGIFDLAAGAKDPLRLTVGVTECLFSILLIVQLLLQPSVAMQAVVWLGGALNIIVSITWFIRWVQTRRRHTTPTR